MFTKSQYIVVAGIVAFASIDARSDSPLPVQHSDEGSSVYLASAAPAQMQRPVRPQLVASGDPMWVFNGEGWEPRQHSYAFSGGRLVHTDRIPHDSLPERHSIDPTETEYDNRS